MSLQGRTPGERRRLYRSGWLVVVFAMCSYLLVAFAEQGSAGAGMEEIPPSPLPFDRHTSAGIDLSGMSSLAALEWLEAADVSGASMVVLPVDGDIVAAFNNPDTYVAARSAVDQLVAATNGARAAVCLQRPITAIDESILAEAAVTALVENYAERITYLGACGTGTNEEWEADVLDVLLIDATAGPGEHYLAPITIGAPLRLQSPVALSDMTGIYLDSLSGSEYVAVRTPAGSGLDDEMRNRITTMLHDRPHIATVLAAPAAESDPASFVATLSLASQQYEELSEGFNNTGSPHIEWNGDWSTTEVGPVTYRRTLETGSWLTTEFIGTEIWAVGIVAPDAGRLGIWVDPDEGPATGEPDRIISLERTQARDASILLVDRLPAARHRITIVAADGEVALSGLFVAGRPAAGWHGIAGSVGLIAAAVAGLSVVLAVAVDDLRIRIGLDQADDQEQEHPRVFRRDV